MVIYSSTDWAPDVDFNSLELMCIYIGEYRCFSKTGINLNAKYCFDFQWDKTSGAEWPTVQVSRNRKHVDLFAEYDVNLKIICGINGVGKTSILELLRHNKHKPNDRYFVLFKDKDDRFLCTKKIPLLLEGKEVPLVGEISDVNLSNLTSSEMEQKDQGLGILLNMASSYFTNKKLFDFDDSPLFTHFNIDVCDERNNHEIIERVLADDFGIKDDLSLGSLWRDHPLVYCFLHFCQDNTLDAVRRKIKGNIGSIDELIAFFAEGENRVTYNALNKNVRSLLIKLVATPDRQSSSEPPEHFDAPVARDLKQHQKEREPRFYPFSKYEQVRNKWQELEEQAFKFFAEILPDYCHINPGIFERLFYLRPVRKFSDGSLRELGDLSHGEFFTVMMKYALLPRMAQTDGVWFDDDEVDKHLHPEWKRLFLYTYLNAIRDTRKMLADRFPDKGYGGKVYSIILTTHSPFLLSDVPGEHVVYLEPSEARSALGLPKTRVRSDDMQNSFCGNIGEMFYSNFFMEETIGEFAKQKIETALKDLENGVHPRRMDEIKELFEIVGDSLLKSLLDEKLAHAKVGNEKD